MAEWVRLEIDNGVATIRLDRPKMNALDAQMQDEIAEAAAAAGDRSDVRAVVVYGGERVFAAGADVKQMAGWSYTDAVDRSKRLQECLNVLAELPKPTVAAINGYALGGGCELALACDFRIAAEDATLGQPEITLGIIPGAGGTQRLPRLIGPSRAKDLIFTGRFVAAEEALSIGLVDRTVPAAEVYAAARAWAEQFVSGPAYALRAAKEAIDSGLGLDLPAGLELERIQFAALFATADQAAGMTSFVTEGPGRARFSGR